jgi:hypothetical protein
MGFQRIESRLPIRPERLDPVARLYERLRFEEEQVVPAVDRTREETCGLEDMDVLRRRGQRYIEGLGQIRDPPRTDLQQGQHVPPYRAGEGSIRAIEDGGSTFNHMVEDYQDGNLWRNGPGSRVSLPGEG